MTTLDLDKLNPCKEDWEAFAASCQAPVYPGSWNSWLLIISIPKPAITAAELVAQVKELFGRDLGGRLFGGVANPEGNAFTDGITNLEVIPFLKEFNQATSCADVDAALKAQQEVALKYQGSSSPILSADLQRMTGRCEVQASGPYWTFVMVNFIYRGALQKVPWLAAKRIDLAIPIMPAPGIPGTNIDAVMYPCPKKPTFLLAEVMAPQSRAPEDPDSIANGLSNGINSIGAAVSEALDKASESATPWIIGGLVVIGGLLFARR